MEQWSEQLFAINCNNLGDMISTFAGDRKIGDVDTEVHCLWEQNIIELLVRYAEKWRMEFSPGKSDAF